MKIWHATIKRLSIGLEYPLAILGQLEGILGIGLGNPKGLGQGWSFGLGLGFWYEYG